jgi:hypothetical protein
MSETARKAPEVFARTNGHEWAEWKFASMTLICCNKCGIVRRPDDRNKPCKGVVKVGLRA